MRDEGRVEEIRRSFAGLPSMPSVAGQLTGPDAAALASVAFDMGVDEDHLLSRLDWVRRGRAPALRINSSIEEVLEALAKRYPESSALDLLITRRSTVRRLAASLAVAASGSLDSSQHAAEHYEQLFCTRGDPPELGTILYALARRKLRVELGEAFGVSTAGAGWAQAMLIDDRDNANLVEIHRPHVRWEGTVVRGTVRQQVGRAVASISDFPTRRAVGRALAETKFIIGVSSTQSEPVPRAVMAIRDYCVKELGAIARVDGTIIATSRDPGAA